MKSNLKTFEVYVKPGDQSVGRYYCGEVLAKDRTDARIRAYRRWYFTNVDCIEIRAL